MSSIEGFLEEPKWGKPVEVERRNRIKLAVAAYSYEMESDSIMSDGDFDKLCLEINPKLPTISDVTEPKQIKRYKKLDKFWANEFEPDTGQWIHKHPELHYVKQIYHKYYKKK